MSAISDKPVLEVTKSAIILFFVLLAVGVCVNGRCSDHEILINVAVLGLLAYVAVTVFSDGVFMIKNGALDDPESGNDQVRMIRASIAMNFITGIALVCVLIGLNYNKMLNLSSRTYSMSSRSLRSLGDIFSFGRKRRGRK